MARGRMSMWVGGAIATIGVGVTLATMMSAWWRVRYWHVSSTPTGTGVGVDTRVWIWTVGAGAIDFGAFDQFPWVDRSWAIEAVPPTERMAWRAPADGVYRQRYGGLVAYGSAAAPSPIAVTGSVVLWPFALVGMGVGGVMIWRAKQLERRTKRYGLCENCGYARRGLRMRTPCPECGVSPT